jgi:hypothetical protein
MKFSKIATSLLGAALLFGTAVLAGQANKATVSIAETVSVEGKTIAPGTYKVQWDGSGTNVQVTLTQGKRTVATFPAQVTEQPNKNSVSAYSSTAEPDGSRSLSAIYVGGKNTVLQVASAAASQQSANQNAK